MRITSAAVSDGWPPSRSDTAIATGVVTDFGASEARTSRGAPSAAAMPTAEAIDTRAPANSAAAMGTMLRSTSVRFR